MNKKEYIESLKFNLRNYPIDFQNDILETFENHFQEGINQGKSEEEIMDSLGTIDEVMENINAMNTGSKDNDFEDNINELGESLKTAFNSFGKIASSIAKNAAVYFEDKNVKIYSDDDDYQLNDGLIEDYVTEVEVVGAKLFKGVDIEVKSGNELKYEFKYKDNIFLQQSTPIEINVEAEKATFNIGNNGGKLIMYLPPHVDYFKTNTSSGDVEIYNVNLKELSVKSSSGDVEVENAKVDYINVELVSGDVEIKKIENDEIDVTTGAGDIEIKDFTGNINVRTNAGDVNAVRCFSNKFVNINTLAGDIEYIGNGPEININTKAGDVESEIIDEFKQANINTTTGDIDCNVNYKNYNLKINTTMGDVDIDIKGCPVTKINKKEFIVGDGEASLNLGTTMGDINIH